jgi:hypothetical protein
MDLIEFEIQTQPPQFMHKHVEGFGNTRPRNIIPFDDRLISLRTADDIIRLQCQQFLQDIRAP